MSFFLQVLFTWGLLMRFGFAGVVALGLLASAPSHAKTIEFDYQALGCTVCGLGMTPGEKINAVLYFDSTSIVPEGWVDSSDLEDFSIDAGTFHIDKSSAAGFSFAGFANSTATAFGSSWFTLIATTAIAPHQGPTAYVAGNGWAIGIGECGEVECQDASVGDDASGNGPATLRRNGPAPKSFPEFQDSFSSVHNNYVSPGPSITPEQLLLSQQTELTTANSTLAYAQGISTPIDLDALTVDVEKATEIDLDLYDLISFIAGGVAGVDPFTGLATYCFLPSCTVLLFPDSASVVYDPYELFAYDYSIDVSSRDLSYFQIGDEYLIDTTLLGDYPGYSVFDVSSISGNKVDFTVHAISQLPDAAPEPLTISLFAAGLLGIGLGRRRKLV